MAIILDGKSLSEEIFLKLQKKLVKLENDIERTPKLSIILVGNDTASQTYVNNKIKACDKVGIKHKLIKLTNDISEVKLEEEIFKLNDDKSVDGIVVQLPLPDHINTNHIINSIYPKKDVDGLHPFNFGKMSLGLSSHIPATPKGIIEILKKYEIPTKGKNCVVVGRSRIVGLPISILMSSHKYPGNSTVTLCHSKN